MGPMEEVLDYQNHKSEKEEQKHFVDIKSHEEIVSDLSVELKVTERDVPRTWDGKSRQIEVFPTGETFEKLRRWEAVHDKYPDAIPYDGEAVKNQDWADIHNVFCKIDSSKYEELYDYIVYRNPSSVVVEQIDEDLYNTD